MAFQSFLTINRATTSLSYVAALDEHVCIRYLELAIPYK